MILKFPGTLRFQKIVILDSLKITNISKKKLKLPETLRSHMGFIVAMTGIVLISFNGQNLELNPF